MKTANFLTSSCRHCRYYQSEGRRGGTCQQLGGPVQPDWKACAVAARPFTPDWNELKGMARLESSLVLDYDGDRKGNLGDREVLPAAVTARSTAVS